MVCQLHVNVVKTSINVVELKSVCDCSVDVHASCYFPLIYFKLPGELCSDFSLPAVSGKV